MDIKELYILFDPCIEYMFALIIPSFARFKNGKKYK